ncbi:MAG: acyl carrier protein [Eubacteriales bacterium]|nr:acyl carrier protein [Eubacteriales bacterium]
MFEKVKAILIEDLQIPESDITIDSELIADLGINSLELADLILMCEEKFNVEIKDEDIHKFISVGDVVNYLTEKSGK